MTREATKSVKEESDWPVFDLQYTYNPDDIAPDKTFEPDEVVLYDAKEWNECRWIAAKRGSYISLTETR